jgi:hypothetical protein
VLACGDLGTKTALVALLGVFTYCTAINWGFDGDLVEFNGIIIHFMGYY